MTKYLLFAGDTYYPLGGWRDYKSDHYTLEDALEAAASCGCDWWQVVDWSARTIVKSFDYYGRLPTK